MIANEDYEELRCPFCTDNGQGKIEIDRVIRKLDEYLSKNDTASAKKHLEYWLKEAEFSKDDRGKLSVIGELIGLDRKLGNKDECLYYAGQSLELAKKLGLENSISYGTVLINAATAYKAFGKADDALPLYESAKLIYESNLKETDSRLGGLYNNMALALLDRGVFDRAKELFDKAITVMSLSKDNAPFLAVTYCNLANLEEAMSGKMNGDTKIKEYLKKAMYNLDSMCLSLDGNYAFVCEKCSSVFGYYGYCVYENELKERAKNIYERA